MTEGILELAWDEVHAAVERRPGWRARRPQLEAHSGTWIAVTYDARGAGRGKATASLAGRAETQADALGGLARLLGHIFAR